MRKERKMAESKIEKNKKVKMSKDTKPKSTKSKSTKAKTSGSSSGGAKKSKSTTTAKSKSTKPKSTSTVNPELKDYLEQRVEQANRLADEYWAYANNEYIMDNARRTLPPSRKKDENLFSADIKTEKAIMREIARMDVFESSIRTSMGDNYEEIIMSKLTTKQSDTIEQMRQEFYKGAFGGQWMKENDDHETYDKSRINKDFAERAFGLYHRLVEKYQSEDYLRMLWSRDSRVTYGSENVIIAIYDMVTQGYNTDADIIEKMSREIDNRYRQIQDMDRRFKTHEDYNRFKR